MTVDVGRPVDILFVESVDLKFIQGAGHYLVFLFYAIHEIHLPINRVRLRE